jgi:hypothetical protein
VLRANKQLAQVTHANPWASSQSTSSRTLAMKTVRSIVHRRIGHVIACYDKALAVQPHLEGIVETEFVIPRAGEVTSVTARGVDPGVAVCIERVIRGLRFVRVDRPIHVSYPFRLTKTGPESVW